MLPIIDSILDIVGKVIPDKNKQLELKKAMVEQEAKLEKQFGEYAKMDHELRLKEIEAKGFKSWWRPGLMFSFGIILTLYCLLYYICPAIVVYFNLNVWIPDAPIVDPALWDLVKFSILGIGGMRTIDKWRKS